MINGVDGRKGIMENKETARYFTLFAACLSEGGPNKDEKPYKDGMIIPVSPLFEGRLCAIYKYRYSFIHMN